MDTFDYIIVLLGVALIIIGLVLFIAGKQDSAKNNQVEGFGIKLNVSNPSIILIVLGIGLVVFPRFMPNSKSNPVTSNVSGQTTQTQLPESLMGTNTLATSPAATTSTEAQPAATLPEASPKVAPQINPQTTTQTAPQAIPQAFFPRGKWYLSQYEENGIDGYGSVQGSIQFNNPSNGRQSWSANIMTFDTWGNQVNYRYVGLIESVSGGHTIDIQSTNEPGFVPPGPSNLILKMDDPYTLHMEYTVYGSALTLHFTQ